ncbi:4'-phosphopantetheinyl transferase superfamily protein [Mucilaginibacter sp.]|uniref:4'-phosphopantetheinyl transferase family protein n=1 Tax=Mucilaginibacter sp. TaxID=1882438 RepID=UPI002609766F|nr:4'-phosphopantetheinyl transferase superfamily protein [Mucilaginibacter sp.]MDB5031801.1 4-phosphopantetheinyl transferase superfamily protein [Mucilaginibacter sp.]
MKSAGNDIVALNVIDKQRTCQPVFYSKFITPFELGLYRQPQMPFDIFVWLLWSVKESAFKYLKKGDANLVFSPSKIIVQDIEVALEFAGDRWEGDQSVASFFKGSILYDMHTLYFKSVIHAEFIATVVDGENTFQHVYWGVQLINESDSVSQSEAVRLFVLNKLNSLFPNHALSIDNGLAGYPILFNNGKEMDIPISFSHHNRYVSYSFLNLK